MLNNKFAIMSVVSMFLSATTDFVKNALETAFRVKLITEDANYSSEDWIISIEKCESIFVLMAIVCLMISIINTIVDISTKKGKKGA